MFTGSIHFSFFQRRLLRRLIQLCPVLMLSLLCSCALFETPPPPEPVPVAPVVKPVKKAPKPVAKKPAVRKGPSVAILLSNDTDAFAGLGDILQKKLSKNATLYSLKGDARRGATVREQLQKSKHDQVVAVGLLAAQVANTLKNKQVVFCKVFNYADNDLLRPWMKGVSMMPPADKVLAQWKRIDPRVDRVLIVTGVGQSDFIERARKAGKKYDIEVVHKVVRNDNEFAFTSKEDRSIKAQWLVPDNRVLSRTALRDVMSHSVKTGRQVFVFDPALLKLGALASVQAIDADIANQVVSKLRFSYGKKQVIGKNIAPVHKIDLKISRASIQRLDLNITEPLKALLQ